VCLQNNELLGIKSTFSFLPLLSLSFYPHHCLILLHECSKNNFPREHVSVCVCVWQMRRISCLHVYVYERRRRGMLSQTACESLNEALKVEAKCVCIHIVIFINRHLEGSKK
jgi:hypothetical protein